MIKITDEIYLNEIPLPNTPLKALNSYIIHSEGETLAVDTGFNLPECMEAFIGGFNELNISPKNADLLITHMHSDHCGLCGELAHTMNRIYIGTVDGEIIHRLMVDDREKNYFEGLNHKFGLSKYNIRLTDNPGITLLFKEPVKFTYLNENDIVKVGRFHFEVIDTPGHTPGHISLYERNEKIMIMGDHVLSRITPNISFWGGSYGDILGVYLKSLQKIRDYDVKYILSSHRAAPESLSQRVDELIAHHEERLEEIMNILSSRAKNAADTAAEMHWSLRGISWDEFPNAQKWFATNEAISHLEHLLAIGKVDKIESDGVFIYGRRDI
ncbi:MAG: MBL fold metallo-hydrolase, partial [Deferribacteraceae bacterium]|nr:MBL fold metallo-hydrolase [Deferribacteraceae bacterium]